MAAEKVTSMVLKVDLQCPTCYKKTKRTLCKFPQIRDQIYDEKANTVTITVICCSPEKIRDKLCCKGGKAIKSIEIKESTKPKEPEKKEPEKKEPEKKEPEKPKEKEKPKGPEKPKVVIVEPKDAGKPKDAQKSKDAGKPKEGEKPKEAEKPKEGEKPKEVGKPKEGEKLKSNVKGDKPKSNGAPPAEKPVEEPNEGPKAEPIKNPGPVMIPFPGELVKGPEPVPVNGVPSVFPYVGPSCDGYGAGPYYHGYGFPPPPPQLCYEGYYGDGHGYGYGHGYEYGRVVNVNRCDSYFNEENPQACSIM